MTRQSGDSPGKASALLVSPEAPYPLAGGGSLRTACLLHYLASRYQVDAIFFRQSGDPDPAAALPQGMVREAMVIELPYHRRHWVARAGRNLLRLLRGVPPLTDRFQNYAGPAAESLRGRRYDVGVIEHFWCASYVEPVARSCRRVVLDLHNIESVLHSRCAASEPWPASAAHRHFARACRALERRWLPRFDLILCPSKEDAGRIARLVPNRKVAVYPNTIPMREPVECPKQQAIVFSGNMAYHPNTAAVKFFRSAVWPRLRQRWPDLTWVLLGKNPQAVERFARDAPRIRLIGAVADAIQELAAATVAVVPLLAGSGTRFKILEAWCAGTPIVSTTLGAEGLPGRHGEHLLLADEPAEFAAAVSSLLESAELSRRLSQAARALYEREFTWESGWESLEKCGF